ncbi:hypothetical protein ATK17_1149 [Branchiibius hedensis]|uniref:Signal transduction histidine kinase n=1 Tax=Branchiibius hedensis TaxID=672460 RepID=A0A2Y9BTD2_9MICO|nr:hypothetical protein [Branchiibius hedensis]PWJ25037.1 hypothetical protein ATK17_1149 [Branchiibius hedensis]SSA33852.1 hypothetical protein SAMN04489750_1149 [Branchiibius hedensis]
MINLGQSWRRVVGSGHFITWPVFPFTGALAVTVMGPLLTLHERADLLPAVLASVAAWVVFAAILAVAAMLERLLSAPVQRAAAVLAGVGVASVSRPFVQDGLMTAFGGHPPDAGQHDLRIVTNVIVWTVTISVIAVAVDAERTRRRVNVLLRQALSQLQSTGQRAAEFDEAARTAIKACTRQFGAEIATWPSRADLADVAGEFAHQRVRPTSHALAQQANGPLPPMHRAVAVDLDEPRRPRLRLPPVGLVVALYLVIFLPYGCFRLSAREVISSLIVLAIGGTLADLVPRRLPHRYLPRRRAVLFLVLSVCVGAGITVSSVVMGHRSGVVVLIPVVAYPMFALAASLCYGAMNSRKVSERRLNAAVAQASRSARLSTATSRTALLTASGLLHRDLQAACVLLAHDPTDNAQILQARAVVEQVGAVFDTNTAGPGWSAFTSLINTWGRVVTIEDRIQDAVRDDLEAQPAAAADAYEVIAEGLLNAVKHAPGAPIRVVGRAVATGAGSSLLVQVISVGARSGASVLRQDSAAARAGAWLHQEPEGVVLEALIPLEHSYTRVVV